MDDIELTPSLLKFYRSKIRELQKDQNISIHNRLKHLDLSTKERAKLERDVVEYEKEIEQTQQDLDHIQNALIRERRAVIELVEENAQLRGIPLLSILRRTMWRHNSGIYLS
jgi:hypothetical protein